MISRPALSQHLSVQALGCLAAPASSLPAPHLPSIRTPLISLSSARAMPTPAIRLKNATPAMRDLRMFLLLLREVMNPQRLAIKHANANPSRRAREALFLCAPRRDVVATAGRFNARRWRQIRSCEGPCLASNHLQPGET